MITNYYNTTSLDDMNEIKKYVKIKILKSFFFFYFEKKNQSLSIIRKVNKRHVYEGY